MKNVDPKLMERLETLTNGMGCELVGCELLGAARHPILRIYIDKPGGVTIDDCSMVSNQISAMMDVQDPIQSRYTLEVSSPGIDRPLYTLKQFQKYIGNGVKIRLSMPINQRKQYKGILKRVDDENIYLLVEGAIEEMQLPFSLIEKANLIGNISF